jgi:catechol 2,3-dioxygenase-like lactoylglutathione lyase family enzyme
VTGDVAPAVTVEEIVLAADDAAWRAAGFRVEDGGFARVGSVALRLAGAAAGKRIVRCTLRGLGSERFDGLPFARAEDASIDAPPSATASVAPHPNGVTRIDHVVAFTPDLDRTVAAGQALGLDLRRIRDEPAPAGSPRQAFFRLGDLILEVAQAPDGSPLKADSPARFYGLAFLVDDIDATAAALGDLCSDPRDAIQPGRRIATVRKEANLGLPVAFMTPRPDRFPLR